MTEVTEPAGTNNPGTTTPTGGEQNPQPVTMTQDALNKLFADRADQAKRSLLTTLGVESEEALKTLIAKAKEQDEAQKTEAQKTADQLAVWQKKAADAEAQKAEALAKANERLINADILHNASELGFATPADALAFVDRSKVKLDETTGKITGVKEALEEVVKVKQYLLKPQSSRQIGTPTQPRPQSGNKPQPQQGQDKSLIRF